MSKKILLSLLTATILSVSSYAEDRVVASYNGSDIKKSEVEKKLRVALNGSLPGNKSDFDELDQNVKQQVLQDVLQQKLLEDDLKHSAIKDSKLFKQQLDEAKKRAEIDLYMQNYVRRHINDAMLKDAYANLVNNLKNNPEVKISHILVATEDEAKKALADIKAGKSFDEEAKAVSIDQATKDRGGEIGYISKGQVFPEVEKAVYNTKVDGITEPIKSPSGWHIIKVLDIKQRVIPEFDKIKTQLDQQVATKIVNDHIKDLSKSADIKVFLDKQGK